MSIQNLLSRSLGVPASGNLIKRWQSTDIDALTLLPEQKLALHTNLAVMVCLDAQIATLETAILVQAKLRADYQALRTVSGIGAVLALTIALAAGEIDRCASPGNFASHARTVNSRWESNGKQKGEGNTQCGNTYRAWAFVEAAHCAVRYDGTIRRYYKKKCIKSLSVVAIKAVARKLASRLTWPAPLDNAPWGGGGNAAKGLAQPQDLIASHPGPARVVRQSAHIASHRGLERLRAQPEICATTAVVA